MGVTDPAKYALFQAVSTSQRKPRGRKGRTTMGKETQETATYLKTPTPPSANTSQEEEEIEMDDEDFYNKMRRQEEYMKRRSLLTRVEGDEGENDDHNDNEPIIPESPEVIPMKRRTRLPPLQISTLGKKTKKKERATMGAETSKGATNEGKKKKERATMDTEEAKRAKSEGLHATKSARRMDNGSEDVNNDPSAYTEVSVLQDSAFGDVKMLDDEVEEDVPKVVKPKKRRPKRDLSHVVHDL